MHWKVQKDLKCTWVRYCNRWARLVLCVCWGMGIQILIDCGVGFCWIKSVECLLFLLSETRRQRLLTKRVLVYQRSLDYQALLKRKTFKKGQSLKLMGKELVDFVMPVFSAQYIKNKFLVFQLMHQESLIYSKQIFLLKFCCHQRPLECWRTVTVMWLRKR